MYSSLNHEAVMAAPSADPEGGGRGAGGQDPHWKSQIKWVSIGDKQLDTSWKKLDLLEKLDPIWSLEKR